MKSVLFILGLLGLLGATADAQPVSPAACSQGPVGDVVTFVPLGTGINVPCDSGAPLVMPPGGRLSAQAGVSVETANQSGVATVYYEPDQSSYVAIWNGSALQYLPISLADGTALSLANNTNFPTTTVFDIFAFNNAGTIRLCAVPYTTSTAGGGVRAVGVHFTTAGILTNASAPAHCYNGSTDYGTSGSSLVPTDQGTYLGSVYTTAAGQTTVQMLPIGASGGGNPILGICNAYNRRQRGGMSLDNGAEYTYNSATIREARASASNRVTWLSCGPTANGTSGVTADEVTANLTNSVYGGTAASFQNDWLLLNSTSTSAPSSSTLVSWKGATAAGVGGVTTGTTLPKFQPVVGLNYVQGMQACLGSGATCAWEGLGGGTNNYGAEYSISIMAPM
jgi:hypothetical protein